MRATRTEVTTVEVLICEQCSGKGTKTISDLSDYHRGTYSYEVVECAECEGSGRMKKTSDIIIVPWKPEDEFKVGERWCD